MGKIKVDAIQKKEKNIKKDMSGGIVIPTSKLAKILNIAKLGIGGNKLDIKSTILGLHITKGLLKVYSSDGQSTLLVSDSIEGLNESVEQYCTVEIDTFSKLISKQTCKELTLNISEKFIEILGNGKYKIPRVQEEGKDGLVDIVFKLNPTNKMLPLAQLSLDAMCLLHKSIKPCIPTNGQSSGVWVTQEGLFLASDGVIGASLALDKKYKPVLTRGFSISTVTMDIFKNSEISIMADGVNYCVLGADKGIDLEFHTPIPKVLEEDLRKRVAPVLEKVITEDKLEGYVALKTSDLIGALDRLSIFTSAIKGETVVFEVSEGLEISAEGQVEMLPLLKSKATKIIPIKAKLSPALFMTILKSVDSEEIAIQYQNGNVFLRIIGDSTKYVLCRQSDI